MPRVGVEHRAQQLLGLAVEPGVHGRHGPPENLAAACRRSPNLRPAVGCPRLGERRALEPLPQSLLPLVGQGRQPRVCRVAGSAR